MPTKSASIQAIDLTRAVFESIHGNIGLLKFNVEELTPKNGKNGEDSKKWEIVCSFLETLGSSSQSRYRVFVDLNDRTVTIKKLSSGQGEAGLNEPEKKFVVTEEKEEKK
ncbi:MAG: hypothetical protein ABR875_01160 [Minisyncoccia bacterium]|jgi:hypothetical protein